MLLASVSAAPLIPPSSTASFDPLALVAVERIPHKKSHAVEPALKAKAALAMDAGTGLVLFEKNSHTPLPMASLTKIMTAVTILESHNLSEVVTIDENYASLAGVKIGLQKNEKITVGNLLIGLLVRSGGDAAMALAKYHSGSAEAFTRAMNQKAALLNLKKTQFKNPIGLDEEGHYSTAYELAMLTKYAMQDPRFRAIVRLPEAEISSINGAINHTFKNTNVLLNSYLRILGVKTGTTDAAGDSIINWARGPEDQEVIAVLLDSPDRFQENKSLIEWSFRNYFW